MLKFTIILVFCLFFSLESIGQNHLNDLGLIIDKQLITTDTYYKRLGNNQSMMQIKHKSLVAKINPITNIMKATMFLYQNVISAQLSKECPYEITCSNFSKQSIKQFGLIKGIFITADRITRCNRISMLDINVQNIDPLTGSIKDPLSKYCKND